MKKRLLFFIIMAVLMSFTYDKPAYKLYTGKGKKIKYSEMITNLAKADFVFIGELHNNPIAHWMELEITKDIYAIKKENTILGAEMFEADNQLIIDEYLTSVYSSKKFEPEMKLWPNYSTDYKPLLNFAKDSNISFIATNIPRRYASLTYKEGFEGLEKLTGEAKKYIAPLPIKYDKNLDCYKSMMQMDGMGAHVNKNLPKSQAIKDATMAYFTNKNWKKGQTFIHYNGSYHSDNHQGIVWYLKKYNKKAKIKTVTTVSQKDLSILDNKYKKQADYIIVVDENMTTTY